MDKNQCISYCFIPLVLLETEDEVSILIVPPLEVEHQVLFKKIMLYYVADSSFLKEPEIICFFLLKQSLRIA